MFHIFILSLRKLKTVLIINVRQLFACFFFNRGPTSSKNITFLLKLISIYTACLSLHMYGYTVVVQILFIALGK